MAAIHKTLFMFESLCGGKMAAGEEFAELARSAVFEVEDIILKGGMDKKRFCKFLDRRLGIRLMNGESTEKFWRAP